MELIELKALISTSDHTLYPKHKSYNKTAIRNHVQSFHVIGVAAPFVPNTLHSHGPCLVQTLRVPCVLQSSVVSAEGTLALHDKAQSMLQQHLMTRASDRAQEQHRQALMAQINTDIELLLSKTVLL